MRVNREELLSRLESLRPGLSSREVLEQSSCFVFKEGNAATFNGEVCCRCPTGLEPSFTGAVKSGPLLNILRKTPDDEIEVSEEGGAFFVRRKGGTTKFNVEADIHLPVEYVEQPKLWLDLHEEFCEAVGLVKECAGKQNANFAITCLHIHPKWIEATDTCQVIRYKIRTGVNQSILVRRDSIKHICDMGMTEFSETDAWIHFKNASGLMMSFGRYPVDQEINLGKHLKTTGSPLRFPKGIKLAAELAGEFSCENGVENNMVKVELEPGRMIIEGTGISGMHRERRKITYNGDHICFLISPKLLGDIVDRYNECQLADDRLKVDGGKWRYISFLGVIENGNGKH